jgi:putative acetyltransferase
MSLAPRRFADVAAAQQRYDGKTHMLIRAAVASDVTGIAAAHAASIREVCSRVYGPAQIHAWVSGKTRDGYLRAIAERRVFVALQDDQVIGFSELDLKTGEVVAVYVRPDLLRQGVGRGLLRALETEAAAQEIGRLNLHATLNAIPFYEAQGFVLDGMTSFPLGPDLSLSCARMYKLLEL